MADAPGRSEFNKPQAEDCTHIYELKEHAEDLPLSESIFKEAQLVCPGDSKQASHILVKDGHLPGLELNSDPETLMLARLALRSDNAVDTLSVGQKETLFKLEEAIIKGDSAAITDQMKAFEKEPKQAEKLMAVLTQELKEVGYNAQWTYSTDENRPGFGQEYNRGAAFGGGYYQAGREDVGHLTLTSDRGNDTYNSVSFSTHGEAAAINSPKPSLDGRESMHNPAPLAPEVALKEMTEKLSQSS